MTVDKSNIHVSDLADAHVAALRALVEGAESAALNLGAGRGWSVCELVDSVRRITNRKVAARVGPRRPGDPPVLVADAARAWQKLGWRPRYSDLGA
jgi:UDP-glucose 4-epimerase